MDAKQLVDYTRSLDCVHCGLCLNTCPTYRLTGAEASSPRGRIHLMRAVAENALEPDQGYADELDFCLLCRNCETVCPSGVQFGRLMEHARSAYEPRRSRGLAWRAGFALLCSRGALRAALFAARFGQVTKLDRALAMVLGARGEFLRNAPRIPPRSEREPLPALSATRGTRLGAVALLEGCVAPLLLGEANRATVRVLTAIGYDVHVPRAHACCGSLHAHNGEADGARALALATLAAFDALVDEHGAPLPLVVNSAGCGSHLKELAHAVSGDPAAEARARALSARTLDLTQFLTREPALSALRAALAAAPTVARRVRAAWDDPCHLIHGQRVRAEPRALLALVPGIEPVAMDLADSCCGAAGIWSLARPADAERVLDPKLEALAACGAQMLISANPGCHLQWSAGIARAGLRVRVAHLAEVLDEALSPSRASAAR